MVGINIFALATRNLSVLYFPNILIVTLVVISVLTSSYLCISFFLYHNLRK